MESIQLFMPTVRIEECLAEIRERLENGWRGLGYKTVEIEDAWKRFAVLPNAQFLNFTAAGQYLAGRILKENMDWYDSGDIISTLFIFFSTNHAILYEKLHRVFAGIDEYLCYDPFSLAECLSPRTRAVKYVGNGGNTGRLDQIVQPCRIYGLKLILDASYLDIDDRKWI